VGDGHGQRPPLAGAIGGEGVEDGLVAQGQDVEADLRPAVEAEGVAARVGVDGGQRRFQIGGGGGGEVRRGAGQHLGRGDRAEVVDLAVGGEDRQPRIVHADQRRADVVDGGVRRQGGVQGLLLAAVGEGGLVAVMAVGDDQAAQRGEDGLHGADDHRVGDRPDALAHLILDQLGYVDVRGAAGDGRPDEGVDAVLRVGVEDEDLLRLNLQGA